MTKASKSSPPACPPRPQEEEEFQYPKSFTVKEIAEAVKEIEEAENLERRIVDEESSLSSAKKKKKKKTKLVKKKMMVKTHTIAKKKKMVNKKKIMDDNSIPGWGPPFFFPSMKAFRSFARTLWETDKYFVDPSTFPRNIADSGYKGAFPLIVPIIPPPVNLSAAYPTEKDITPILDFALKEEEKKRNFLKLERIKYCNEEDTGMYCQYYITFEASSSDDNNNQIIADYQTQVCKNGLTGVLRVKQFRPKPPNPYF